MIQEKDFEDILSRYPELIEEGLTLKGRQVPLYGRRMDLLFEDKFKRNLIVELKIGPIKDQHIGQVLSYEGMLLSSDDPTIRVMLIGNRVPPNVQKTLDHHGIAWREIPLSGLKEFLTSKNDDDFLGLLKDYESNSPASPFIKPARNLPIYKTTDEIIDALKASEIYLLFKSILNKKEQNEIKAREILINNIGDLTIENLREVINLIDGPYPYNYKGKVNNGPWFGRLLQANTINLYSTEPYKINNWFNILTNNIIPLDKKLKLLLTDPYNIKGLNVGFITLMLYVLYKNEYQVWFQGLHDGLMITNPNLETYSGKPDQYLRFNETAMRFAEKYSFTYTELDWIFSTGLPSITGGNEYSEIEQRKASSPSSLRTLQQEYWHSLKDYLEGKRSSVRMRNAGPKSWSDISLGRSEIYLAVGMNTQTRILVIWLVIRGNNAKTCFDKLYNMAYQDSLTEISREIKWDRMEGRQRCAVILEKPADFRIKSEWFQQFEWFRVNIENYVRLFKPIIKNV